MTKAAARERWQERLGEFDRKAREKADQRKVGALEAIHERHLRALRLIQGKAIEALRQMPIESAMDAVRSLGLSINIHVLGGGTDQAHGEHQKEKRAPFRGVPPG